MFSIFLGKTTEVTVRPTLYTGRLQTWYEVHLKIIITQQYNTTQNLMCRNQNRQSKQCR